jgi:MFS family permease
MIFLSIYLTRVRGYSPSYAGLVIGVWGAGGAGGTLLGGVLADRWGRKKTLLLSYLSSATLMLAFSQAHQRYAILAGAIGLGTATEMARPAFAAMMVDVVPPEDRLRAFNLNYWAINLGFACSAALAGLLASVSYLVLFLADAGTTLITAAIVLSRVREPRRVPGPVRGPAQRAEGIGTVFRDRVFMAFAGLNILIALIFMQHLSMLPITMGRDGLSPATYGIVIAFNGVLIVAGQLFVPRLTGRWAPTRVLALAAVIVGVGFGLTAFVHTAPLYALTVLIWTSGEMLNSPSTSTTLAELAPRGLRGRYQGVYSLNWSIATFLAPVLGGLVQQHLGRLALWLGCAGIGAVVAVGHLVAGPSRQRRVAELRAAEGPVVSVS